MNDFVFKFLPSRGLEAISSIVKTLSSLRNAHKMNVEEQDRKSNEHSMLLSVMSNKMEYVMSMQARHGNMLRELEESYEVIFIPCEKTRRRDGTCSQYGKEVRRFGNFDGTSASA